MQILCQNTEWRGTQELKTSVVWDMKCEIDFYDR